MQRRKIILFSTIGIIIIGIFGWFFLNKSLNTKDVKAFIQEQLPENIDLKYEKLSTNIFLGEFKLKNAEVHVKDKGIRVKVDEFNIFDLDYTNLLNTDTIDIGVSEIKNAYVWVDRAKMDTSQFLSNPKRRNIILKLGQLNVDFAGLEVRDTNGDVQAKMNETHLGLNDLLIQSKPKLAKNQVKYALVKIKTDSLVLPLSSTQNLSIGNLELDSTQFKLKNTRLSLPDKGIELNFDLLDLRGNDFNQLLSKDTVDFTECILTKGKIKINNAKPQTQATKDSLTKAQKVIQIKEFRIVDTDFEFIDKQNQPQIKFDHTNAYFTDLKILTAPHADENAISYTFINLNAKNLKFPMNQLHTLTVDDMEVVKNKAELNDLKIKPNFNRVEFQKHIKEENDVIDLNIPKTIVQDYDFSFDDNNKFFAASHLILNQPDVTIFRDKTLPDQTPRKPLYSEMLRKLDFHLNLNQITIANANINYEEKVSVAEKAGKIYFTNFDAKIHNINNKNISNDQVKISVDAKFMGHAPTHVDWNFNIHSPADYFTISGTVNNLNANKMDNFLIPNMKARLDGWVQKVTFNFTGNDKGASGRMDMLYEDMKVEVLNHKNEKKGVISTIANFLVKGKKDKKDEVNNLVNVTRDQQKSFFNLFWLCLKEGIKQNMMRFQSKKDEIKKE